MFTLSKILGIFEEEGNDQRRRGKRELKEHIISFAKYLLTGRPSSAGGIKLCGGGKL